MILHSYMVSIYLVTYIRKTQVNFSSIFHLHYKYYKWVDLMSKLDRWASTYLMVVWSTEFCVADNLNRLFFPDKLLIVVRTVLVFGIAAEEGNVVAAVNVADDDNEDIRLEETVDGWVEVWDEANVDGRKDEETSWLLLFIGKFSRRIFSAGDVESPCDLSGKNNYWKIQN